MRRPLVLLTFLVLADIASAQGRIPLNAAAAFSLRGDTPSCAVSLSETSPGAGGQFIIRQCDPTTAEGFLWYIRWLPGMPTTGTIAVDLEGENLAASGNICVQVALGCSASSSATLSTLNLTFGAVSEQCEAYNFDFANFTIRTFAAVALPSTIAQDRWCALRVVRNAANASDTADSSDWIVRGGAVRF